MTFENITYTGPPVSNAALLRELPSELAAVLAHTNGMVAGRGAIHLRGVCDSPLWHSLEVAWRGPLSFAARYRSVRQSDIPFAQDALGDQYLWREGTVWRLNAESDELELQESSLPCFLDAVSADAATYLKLGPLVAFWEQNGSLVPGQLLSVYPPLLVRPDAGRYSYRAVSAADRLGALADFAARVRDLPDGTQIVVTVNPPAG